VITPKFVKFEVVIALLVLIEYSMMI